MSKLIFAIDEYKLGKSPNIEIKNSKDNAIMSGSWSGTDAGFLNKLLGASNHGSLINEAYLIVDGNSSDNLSVNNVHYPHHGIKDGSLVVNARGVQSAFSRARQQGVATGGVLSHIKKHYKELGLNMDNFESFGLSKEDYNFMFSEKNNEKEVQKVSKVEEKVEEMTSDINTEATASAEMNEKQAEVNKDLTNEDKAEEKTETDNLVKEEKMTVEVEIEDKDDAEEEKTEDFKAMYEEMCNMCNTMKAEKEAYLAENESLKQFKMDMETKEMMGKVEYTLADVLDSMPKEKMEELREDAKNFSLENISIWENKVKAEAFSFSKGKENKDGYIKIGTPFVEKQSKKSASIWDKL